MKQPSAKNILGTELENCCTHPPTGYFRDGFCRADENDWGQHVVCAIVTKEFLEFSMSRGNDLMTPKPESQFPGLKPGDRWCLCALRWREAYEAGVAPTVKLESTHEKALELIPLEVLQAHGVN